MYEGEISQRTLPVYFLTDIFTKYFSSQSIYITIDCNRVTKGPMKELKSLWDAKTASYVLTRVKSLYLFRVSLIRLHNTTKSISNLIGTHFLELRQDRERPVEVSGCTGYDLGFSL